MNDLVAAFEPLARLTLGDGYRGKTRERWVRPLAQLLLAASRGQGHLPQSICPVGLDAPAEFFAIADGMVLLPRNAACWREIRERVQTLHAIDSPPLPDARVRDALEQILPHQREVDSEGRVIFDNEEQRLAAAAFVDAPIGVLTGGPGTGKTTSAAALLAIRKRLTPALSPRDVLLCAPTGKAACRLADSMKSAASRLALSTVEREFLCALVPLTIHRALEWSPIPPEKGGPFRRGAHRPLTQKLVLLDEASMVDLDLMVHLLRALCQDARLLLLGDSDQLESVETGGVLAELVAKGGSGAPTALQLNQRSARLGRVWQVATVEPTSNRNVVGELPGLVISLHHSYRAKRAPWILELARIARPGSNGTVAEFMACCQRNAPNIQLHPHRRLLAAVCREHWGEAQMVANGWTVGSPPADSVLSEHLRRFQLLAGDNAQVARANHRGTSALWGDSHERGGLALPHGCPVLITQNRTALGLSNGDVGVALGESGGSAAQVVAFPGLGRPIPVAQLPEHQPAFALTIHKSQGSEWERVAIDLPDESELLDRNLLYTALTRSGGTLDLYVNDERALATILA